MFEKPLVQQNQHIKAWSCLGHKQNLEMAGNIYIYIYISRAEIFNDIALFFLESVQPFLCKTIWYLVLSSLFHHHL